MSIASMSVTLDLNTNQFSSQITYATGQVRTFNSTIGTSTAGIKRMQNQTRGLVSSLRDGMVILGQFRAALHTIWAFTGQWVGAIIQANAELEQLKALMRGVSTAITDTARQTEAVESLNQIVEMAGKAPFSLNELGKGFVKLKSSGIDPMRGAMTALTNSVAAFGGDDQVFHRATIAVQQMAGKGVISMEELRQQLGEAVPDAMRLLARSANMTVGELVKSIESGTVASIPAMTRMFDEMNIKHAGAAQAMMGTWRGLIAQIKTEWFKLAAEIGGDPDDPNSMYGAAKQGLKALLDTMKDPAFIDSARQFGRTLADLIKAGVSFAKFLIENRDMVQNWAETVAAVYVTAKIGAWIGGLTATAGGLRGLTAALTTASGAKAAFAVAGAKMSGMLAAMGGPVGLAVMAIGLFIAKMFDLRREAREASEGMRDFWDSLADPKARASAKEIDNVAEQLRQVADLTERANALRAGGNQDNSGFATWWFKRKAANLLNTGMGEDFASVDETFDSLMLKVDEYQKRLKDGFSVMTNRNVLDDRTATVARRAEDILEAASKEARDLEIVFAGIFDRLEKGEITGAESRTLRAEAATTSFARQIALIEEEIAKVLPNGLPENLDSLPDSARKLIDKLVPEMNRLREQMATFNEMGELELISKNKKSTDELIRDNRLVNYLDQTTAKIAQLKAASEDTSPSVERFNALLNGDGNYFGKNPDAGIVGQIRAALVELERLNKEAKELQDVANVFTQLENISARAAADFQTASAGASGDVYSDVSRGIAGFERQVATLRLTMQNSNQDMEKFEETVAAIRNQIANTDMIRYRKELEDLGAAAREATMTPNVARRSALDRQLAQMDAQLAQNLASWNGTQEERTRILELHTQTRMDLESQYLYESRSSWQRWIDDYKDITEEMDNAFAGAMDKMTDSIMNMVETGKFSFKDLATSILKEITRIMTARVVAQFADMMINMMGGGGGGGMGGASGGGMSGWGNFTGANATQGYGGGTGMFPVGGGKSMPSGVSLGGSSAMIGKAVSDTPPKGGASSVSINIVNETKDDVEAEETGRRFDGQQLILDVVLSAASRPGRFRDGLKGAVS